MSCMLVLSLLYLMSKGRQDSQDQQKEMANPGWSSLCPPLMGCHGDLSIAVHVGGELCGN